MQHCRTRDDGRDRPVTVYNNSENASGWMEALYLSCERMATTFHTVRATPGAMCGSHNPNLNAPGWKPCTMCKNAKNSSYRTRDDGRGRCNNTENASGWM